MSDSVKKYHEMVEEGLIDPIEKLSHSPTVLTEEQKAQAFRILVEYDEEVIKFAFNRLMFG